jgi:pimeloyl-ACP methyl ester carboxylesterase
VSKTSTIQPLGSRPARVRSAALIPIVAIVLLAPGCGTPVGVSRIDPEAAYRLNTESALSVGQPSEPSKMVLRRLGLLDRFDKEPKAVLAELHRGLAPSDDEDRLFALAELSFLYGERSGDRAYSLASAVYAYALLFPGEGSRVEIHRSDPRLRLTYDLYNQGLAEGLTVARQTPGVKRDETVEVRLESGSRPLPFGRLELVVDPSGLSWAGYPLEHFVSATTLRVRGLRNRYRRPGIGAPMAASLAPTESKQVVIGADRIGPRTKVPVTTFVRFDDARASLASGNVRGHLALYAADQSSTVSLDGRPQPLEFDSTAALAYQLEGSPLYGLEIAAFFRGGVFGRILPRDRTQDGLFTLHPYQRGKIPVVLVHGTASSPVRWAELINELEGDPRIRDQYQIWVFLYDTGNPIGYSAGRLRKALADALAEFDPNGEDPALHRMVVIGHSQGGLLTKLTAIDTGTRIWDRVSDKPFNEVKLAPDTRQLLQQSMFFTPLPFVGRVIFIATPHRGALMAGGRLGAIAASLVRLPAGIMTQMAAAATGDEDARLAALLRRPPTAIDNMNPNNPGLKIIASIPVPPTIPAHSIVAVKGTGPVDDGDDGVVAYRSAHIDEVVSQVVVRSGHSCQGNPETIEEVRRILLLHAAVSGVTSPP